MPGWYEVREKFETQYSKLRKNFSDKAFARVEFGMESRLQPAERAKVK